MHFLSSCLLYLSWNEISCGATPEASRRSTPSKNTYMSRIDGYMIHEMRGNNRRRELQESLSAKNSINITAQEQRKVKQRNHVWNSRSHENSSKATNNY